MASSCSRKTESGEPSSYRHMEQKLSEAVARTGEETQESSSRVVTSSQQSSESTQDQLPETTSFGRSNPPPSAVPSSSFETASMKVSAQETKTLAKTETHPDRLNSQEVSHSTRDLKRTSRRQTGSAHRADQETNHTVGGGLPTHALSSAEQSTIHLPGTVPQQPLKHEILATGNGTAADEFRGPPRIIHAEITTKQAPTATQPSTHRSGSSTAIGHGQSTGSGQSKSKNGTPLRRGKWTVEEEAYVARVIQDFNSGFLNAPAGTTLRSYLSEKLQCDPMRITKKFTGDACIGKRVFHPAVRSAGNAAAIDKAQTELNALERRWRRRLEMQQRESAKKAAASAAATNVATSNGRGTGAGLVQGIPVAYLSGMSTTSAGPATAEGVQQMRHNVVTQAASWLDRANAILHGNSTSATSSTANNTIDGGGGTSLQGVTATTSNGRQDNHTFDSMPSSEIENQMKEVQRLIYEGPLIQQTTAGLPHLLPQSTASNNDSQLAGTSTATTSVALDSSRTRTTTATTIPTAPLPTASSAGSAVDSYNVLESTGSHSEPADKRMRTTLSGTEDAEALVGFIRSVRAAAGQDLSN